MTQAVATTDLKENGSSARPQGVLGRLGLIVLSHGVVDVYAAFVPPLLGLLEVRCRLTAEEAAWLLGIGSLASGASQPASAWLSDRWDTRLFGALGLAIGAICLCCIGLAQGFASLMLLYAVGTIGVGIFHPTGASSMGELADQLPGGRRSMGLSVFHVAGMIGGIAGSLMVTRLTSRSDGFTILQYLMIPGLLMALVLRVAIRHVPHRHANHADLRSAIPSAEMAVRWRMVWLLYACNAIRFTVNMIIVYLFVRWVNDVVAAANPGLDAKAVAREGSPIVGNLNAMLIVGMAIGGVSASALVRQGGEKLPMILLPLAFAPVIAAFPYVNVNGAYALSILIGAGFAAMIPISLGMAQRLLPHRTSLASGLMLGGAWALAFMGPRAAEFCLGTLQLSLPTTFLLTAVLLITSSIVCLGLRTSILRKVARVNGA